MYKIGGVLVRTECQEKAHLPTVHIHIHMLGFMHCHDNPQCNALCSNNTFEYMTSSAYASECRCILDHSLQNRSLGTVLCLCLLQCVHVPRQGRLQANRQQLCNVHPGQHKDLNRAKGVQSLTISGEKTCFGHVILQLIMSGVMQQNLL